MSKLDKPTIEIILSKILKVKIHKIANCNHVTLATQKTRCASTNSIVNIFRNKNTFPYKQIIIDVADKISHGYTPLSWTKFTLSDSSTDEEIESFIFNRYNEILVERIKKLNKEKTEKLHTQIKNNIDITQIKEITANNSTKEIIIEQIIEALLTKGIVGILGIISANGLLGLVGSSLLTQIGLTVAINTVGYTSGILALTGFSAISLSTLGALSVGSLVSIPGLVFMASHTNYKKIIPIIILLIINNKIHQIELNSSQSTHNYNVHPNISQ